MHSHPAPLATAPTEPRSRPRKTARPAKVKFRPVKPCTLTPKCPWPKTWVAPSHASTSSSSRAGTGSRARLASTQNRCAMSCSRAALPAHSRAKLALTRVSSAAVRQKVRAAAKAAIQCARCAGKGSGGSKLRRGEGRVQHGQHVVGRRQAQAHAVAGSRWQSGAGRAASSGCH